MKIATYYQSGGLEPKELHVVNSGDGKADLGTKDGEVIVSGVPIATGGAPGTCVIPGETPAPAPASEESEDEKPNGKKGGKSDGNK